MLFPGKFDERDLTVRLVGGLGNQLFQYFAGAYYADSIGKRLTLDTSHVGPNRTAHGVSIEDFRVQGSFVDRRLRLSEPVHKLERLFIRRQQLSNPAKFSSTTEVGFDDLLSVSEKAIHLSGYFQSSFFAETMIGKSQTYIPILKHPSDWFVAKEKEARSVKPLVIHVRRGDYASEGDRFGLLSAEYYRDALQELKRRGLDSRIWVFSDDIPKAMQLLHGVVPAETKWIDPPAKIPPSESLMLMGLGVANVIANSTFSWFGAYLSTTNVAAVRPAKWFKGMQDPNRLGPDNWIEVESRWTSDE